MFNALSVISLAAMAVGITGLFFSNALFAKQPWVIAVQVAMFALMVWARLTFAQRTDGVLVTNGPYAYLRHPIYAAIIHFVWAGALDSFSWPVLGWAETVTAGAFTRMHLEEYVLKRKYPEYRDYRKRAKKFIPFVY